MGRRRHPLTFRRKINLNPDINRGLLAILLFVVSGLSTLSFFSMAGVSGQFIDSLLAVTFGQVRFVFPLITAIVAILLVKDWDYEYRSTHFLGAILFFLGFNGLVHLRRPLSEMTALAMQGEGGGLVGLSLAWPGAVYLGYWGSVVVLAGLLLAAIIFLFNTSFARLVDLHKRLFLFLGWGGRQIINAAALLRKNAAVGVKINGEYRVAEDEEPALPAGEFAAAADNGEEGRLFAKRSLARQTDAAGEEATEEEEKIKIARPKIDYRLPPMDILFISKTKPTAGDIKSSAEIIRDTMVNFGIEVEMGEVRVGPTVSQYSFKPAKGIKLTRITALSDNLALALAAHPIRIEAPIPGRSLVGVEVPNQKVALVTLRELLEGQEFKERKHNMMVALGKDVAGKVWFADLPRMPHLLIAGATGSGKTICINAVILSLLYQNTPSTLRFIMVDPKRVELTLYDGIPHLLTPVITEPQKTINALKWTIGEMERRFDALAKSGSRDMESYNRSHAEDVMPHIVFVIDELADLMATVASEVEAGIIRLAQMARAVGIHLIVATQRPSVEILTGLIKANIPTRIAFSVASIMDSRVILDCPGADKLLGRGDMLYLTAELTKPKRLQGAFVSEEEIKRVVNFLKEQGGEAAYDDTIVSKQGAALGTVNMFGGPNDDQDSLFGEAKKIIVESGRASASLLQRRLRVGYARAARLLDELEEAGIVGPADGAKPREVFADLYSDSGEIPDEEQSLDAGGVVLDESDPSEGGAESENEMKSEEEL